MHTGRILTIVSLVVAAILTIVYTPLGYYTIKGYGTWGEYLRIVRASQPEGNIYLLVLPALLCILILRSRALVNWLETLLTEPPLLDLVYTFSAVCTVARDPWRNVGELIRRTRARQNTPMFTTYRSGGRRLSLQRFVHTLTNTTKGVTRRPLRDGSINRLRGVCLYNVVKRLRPNVVVETGVAGGHMSWYILQALSENGKGLLISIDLPNYRPEYFGAPRSSSVGCLVPKELRDKWELLLEDSRTSLPRVAEAHEIDLFVHDSEHTHDSMMNEFEVVWPHLNPGGVLLAHDAGRTFADFAQRVGRAHWIWERYGGITK